MKTNHQRGFVNNTDVTPVRGHYRMYSDRRTGAWAIVMDVMYNGHQGLARAKNGAKASVRHTSRRFHKRELQQILKELQ